MRLSRRYIDRCYLLSASSEVDLGRRNDEGESDLSSLSLFVFCSILSFFFLPFFSPPVLDWDFGKASGQSKAEQSRQSKAEQSKAEQSRATAWMRQIWLNNCKNDNTCKAAMGGRGRDMDNV